MATDRVSSRGGHWLSEERRVDRFLWMRDVENAQKTPESIWMVRDVVIRGQMTLWRQASSGGQAKAGFDHLSLGMPFGYSTRNLSGQVSA